MAITTCLMKILNELQKSKICEFSFIDFLRFINIFRQGYGVHNGVF